MIDRSNMPQINSADVPALLDWLADRGVYTYHREIDASLLSTRQAVSAEHAAAMPASALAKPVLVSSDLIVLDGNHRAAANAALGHRATTVVIGLPFAEAIPTLFEFPGVSVKAAA